MDTLAMRLRTAFNARDVDTFRGLLAEDARWGDDPDAPTTCHNRAEIIAHLKRLLNEGVRATITETTTGPRGIACVLEVEWPDAEPESLEPATIYQSYLVTDGLITQMKGHEDLDSALSEITH